MRCTVPDVALSGMASAAAMAPRVSVRITVAMGGVMVMLVPAPSPLPRARTGPGGAHSTPGLTRVPAARFPRPDLERLVSDAETQLRGPARVVVAIVLPRLVEVDPHVRTSGVASDGMCSV